MTTDAAAQSERFRRAVALMDAGDVDGLERVLANDPALVGERLREPGGWLVDAAGEALDSFFARPYLLWFVAEDPVRNGRLPANAARVAEAIIRTAKEHGVPSLQEQLDYGLRLVAWSFVARRCGVSEALVDVLMDAGARPSDGITHDALVNGNFATAERLVQRGARLTLATALCLERWDDADRIARTASPDERQVALALAALHGKVEALRRLIALGVDVSGFCKDVYTHSTPLHQAVASGSLAAVQLLVEAGAGVDVKDHAWGGTPLGWAAHFVEQAADESKAAPYREIEAYLRARQPRTEGRSTS